MTSLLSLIGAVVVALGDSITFGYGLSHPSTQSYAAILAQQRHAALVNLAVPGAQCDDVVNNQIPRMPRSASIVILNCGANDIGGFGLTDEGKPDGTKRTAPANDAELNLAKRAWMHAVALIRAGEPKATIFLVNLRHWQRMTGPESPQFARDVRAWNAMLVGTKLPLVDISSDSRMYEPAYILPDVLHPNAEGNVAIASDFPKAWMMPNASQMHSMRPSKRRSFPTAKRAR